MFGLFNKKLKNNIPALPEEKWLFIANVFHKISKIKNSKERLKKSIDLFDQISNLESEYNEDCYELNLVLDDINDAFRGCEDFDTLVESAVIYADHGRLSNIGFANMFTLVANKDLAAHLKVRLFQSYLVNELDMLEVDPREQDPELQAIFYEVESRNLTDWDKAKVLDQEFGIKDWKSLQKMNPRVIFDPIL